MAVFMCREITIYWGPNSDFVEALLDSGARFFIRGGTAVHFYDPTRVVGDLDLLIEPSRETAEKVHATLSRAIWPDMLEFTVDDLAQPGKHVRITRPLYVDVLTPKRGIDFAQH